MEQPLVSVVTITRNRGNLLKRCVSSVLSQTYKNIEHIVVDGASDDNTDEVINEIKDSRLRFVKLDTNWPIKETIDHGISLCKGKYISFLDSDDEYAPDKIEKQVKLINSLPGDYGFIYCWMTYFDHYSKKELYVHKAELRGFVAEDVVSFPIVSGTPTLMFRSEVLREMDGWKSVDEIGIISDWELCARACQKYKVDFVPESLVKVYVNHGSVRQSQADDYYRDSYRRTIMFHEYFLETYNEIFNKKPSLKWYHYSEMVNAYLNMGEANKAYMLYLKLLILKPNLKNIMIPLRFWARKILR